MTSLIDLHGLDDDSQQDDHQQQQQDDQNNNISSNNQNSRLRPHFAPSPNSESLQQQSQRGGGGGGGARSQPSSNAASGAVSRETSAAGSSVMTATVPPFVYASILQQRGAVPHPQQHQQQQIFYQNKHNSSSFSNQNHTQIRQSPSPPFVTTHNSNNNNNIPSLSRLVATMLSSTSSSQSVPVHTHDGQQHQQQQNQNPQETAKSATRRFMSEIMTRQNRVNLSLHHADSLAMTTSCEQTRDGEGGSVDGDDEDSSNNNNNNSSIHQQPQQQFMDLSATASRSHSPVQDLRAAAAALERHSSGGGGGGNLIHDSFAGLEGENSGGSSNRLLQNHQLISAPIVETFLEQLLLAIYSGSPGSSPSASIASAPSLDRSLPISRRSSHQHLRHDSLAGSMSVTASGGGGTSGNYTMNGAAPTSSSNTQNNNENNINNNIGGGLASLMHVASIGTTGSNEAAAVASSSSAGAARDLLPLHHQTQQPLLQNTSSPESPGQYPFQHTRRADENFALDGARTVNQYVLLMEVGRGNQGVVHLGFDNDLQEMRAVKEIPRPMPNVNSIRSKVETRRQRRRIRQEINIMKRCKHPNLVRLHEVIDDEQSPNIFLAMNFIEHGKLFTLLPDGTTDKTFPIRLVVRWAAQLTSALEYLHTRRICHADISAQNVLLGQEEKAFLSDFGISRIFPAAGDEKNEENDPIAASIKALSRRGSFSNLKLAAAAGGGGTMAGGGAHAAPGAAPGGGGVASNLVSAATSAKVSPRISRRTSVVAPLGRKDTTMPSSVMMTNEANSHVDLVSLDRPHQQHNHNNNNNNNNRDDDASSREKSPGGFASGAGSGRSGGFGGGGLEQDTSLPFFGGGGSRGGGGGIMDTAAWESMRVVDRAVGTSVYKAPEFFLDEDTDPNEHSGFESNITAHQQQQQQDQDQNQNEQQKTPEKQQQQQKNSEDAPSPASPQRKAVDPKNFESLRAGDVWSLGTVLFCALYGRLPYALDNFMDYLDKLTSSARLNFPAVSARDDEVIERRILDALAGMLDKNPETRFSAAEARDVWQKIDADFEAEAFAQAEQEDLLGANSSTTHPFDLLSSTGGANESTTSTNIGHDNDIANHNNDSNNNGNNNIALNQSGDIVSAERTTAPTRVQSSIHMLDAGGGGGGGGSGSVVAATNFSSSCVFPSTTSTAAPPLGGEFGFSSDTINNNNNPISLSGGARILPRPAFDLAQLSENNNTNADSNNNNHSLNVSAGRRRTHAPNPDEE